MDSHFVARIASIYLERYKTQGRTAASQYADRVIGDNELAQEQIRQAVSRMITGGKKPNG